MSELYLGPTNGELIIRALRRWGDRVAFTGHGGNFTYRQACELIGRYQAVLMGAGAKPGERMALLHSNMAEAWLASVAAQTLGLCLTPMHPLGSFDDHRFVLEDGEIDYLLISTESFTELGGALLAATERLKRVFTVGPTEFGLDLREASAALGSMTPRCLADPEGLGGLAYTGGTTGKAKGVMRTHKSFAAMTRAVLAEFEWPAEITFLAVAPISHVGGAKITPTLIRGGRVHFMHGFDPGHVLDTMASERITTTLLVPTMINVLLDHPKVETTDLSSLQLLMYGASPMSPTRLLEGLEKIGPVFSQLYGQTEGYPLTVLRKGDHDPARPELFSSCGAPSASTRIALLDDDGVEVGPGDVGEICARAPQVMSEYWKRPEETAAALAGGWLHTGDMAYADDEGYLYIVDRKKDMIISGGFNIFPREIEDILTGDPAVAMAAVIGVPDDKWGEAVKAVVVPRPGHEIDPKALMQRVKDVKGAIHAPKSVDVESAIPMTALGKPDKKALREKFWAGRDRRVG